jgi:drug/metabolite transporter (DMT)-like permease
MLGLSGLVVLLSAHGIALGPDKLIGIGLALASAILFALGGVMTKSPLPIAPTALAAWQVGLGCLPMIVLGLLFERANFSAITASGWTVLIFMALYFAQQQFIAALVCCGSIVCITALQHCCPLHPT